MEAERVVESAHRRPREPPDLAHEPADVDAAHLLGLRLGVSVEAAVVGTDEHLEVEHAIGVAGQRHDCDDAVAGAKARVADAV